MFFLDAKWKRFHVKIEEFGNAWKGELLMKNLNNAETVRRRKNENRRSKDTRKLQAFPCAPLGLCVSALRGFDFLFLNLVVVSISLCVCGSSDATSTKPVTPAVNVIVSTPQANLSEIEKLFELFGSIPYEPQPAVMNWMTSAVAHYPFARSQ